MTKTQIKSMTIVMSLMNVASGLGIISTQVLQEFFVTLTNKIPKPLKVLVVREMIKIIIIRATEIQERYKYSFWDSLIIASAIGSGVFFFGRSC